MGIMRLGYVRLQGYVGFCVCVCVCVCACARACVCVCVCVCVGHTEIIDLLDLRFTMFVNLGLHWYKMLLCIPFHYGINTLYYTTIKKGHVINF